MSKVIILKGLPASGKSTWAKEQVENGNGKIKRVNKDDLRDMIDCGKWSRENEEFILAVRDAIIGTALMRGKDVIVDDTNFEPKHIEQIKRISDMAEMSGCPDLTEFEEKFFECDVHECIKRDSQRAKPVGVKVILGMYDKYLKPKPPIVEHIPELPNCIICDIDGTLAKMNGRSPFEWDKVDQDEINTSVAHTLWLYHEKGHKIILVSGRDESCREKTEEWLRNNAVHYSELFMRPEGNNEDDRIIKGNIYEKEIKGKYNVILVMDDRNKVVDFWRSQGLVCFQVADGNF